MIRVPECSDSGEGSLLGYKFLTSHFILKWWEGLECGEVSAMTGSAVKDSLANTRHTGDASPVPESGRSPGGGNSSPLQYPCLKSPMVRGGWWAASPQGRKEWDMTEWSHTVLSTHPSKASTLIAHSPPQSPTSWYTALGTRIPTCWLWEDTLRPPHLSWEVTFLWPLLLTKLCESHVLEQSQGLW